MNFLETPLDGAFVIESKRIADERGFFGRTFCAREFKDRGLRDVIAQCNISFNEVRGTLRGMHFQKAPFGQAKLVRCTMGALHDVIIDLRKGSPTYRKSFGIDLTAANRRMLYFPEGFAHGFITLEDNTEIFYQLDQAYAPNHLGGVRWDDPAFGIQWPMSPTRIAPRDASYPDLANVCD